MAAIVTDQFRIANANNFIDSVLSNDDSYYVFLDYQIQDLTAILLDLVEQLLGMHPHLSHQLL